MWSQRLDLKLAMLAVERIYSYSPSIELVTTRQLFHQFPNHYLKPCG
jgi:hypothetical protein